jgi:membrane protein DedA with SNARE-associated domain
MTPFLIAAGAAQYSRNRFAASLFLGRGVRYAILGVLAAFYGSAILSFFSEHKLPIIATGIALMLAGVGFAVFRSKYHRSKHA